MQQWISSAKRIRFKANVVNKHENRTEYVSVSAEAEVAAMELSRREMCSRGSPSRIHVPR